MKQGEVVVQMYVFEWDPEPVRVDIVLPNEKLILLSGDRFKLDSVCWVRVTNTCAFVRSRGEKFRLYPNECLTARYEV